MAIPEEIQKKANDIRTKVYGREVRESLARGIEVAGDIADNADTKSTDAVDQVNNIQGQVDQLVIEGDSSVEAAQARVNLRGETFETLKRRIDNLDEEFTQRAVNVKWFGASGSEQQTIGSIAMGSNQLTVLNSIDFKPGQGISIEGAGEDGRVLITKIVSIEGASIKIEEPAETGVVDVEVRHDDTEAIQSAIDSISNVGVVYLPYGVYITTNTIVQDKSRVFLDGQHSRIDYHGDVGTFALNFGWKDTDGMMTGGIVYGVVKNLEITCQNKLNNGFDLTRFRYGFIDNVTVRNAGIGMQLNDSWGTRITNGKQYTCDTGIDFGAQANGVSCYFNLAERCQTGAKLSLRGGEISGGSIFEQCDVGMEVTGARTTGNISGCYFERNKIDVLWQTSIAQSYSLVFEGCYFLDTEEDLFKVDTSPNNAVFFKVSNCAIRSTPSNFIINHQSGDIAVQWYKNIFRDPALDIPNNFTNSTRYDRFSEIGDAFGRYVIEYVPNLSEDWEEEKKVQINKDAEGYFVLNGIVRRNEGSNSEILVTDLPIRFIPQVTEKFVVPVGSPFGLGAFGAVSVRTDGQIRVYFSDDTDTRVSLHGIRWR